MSAAASDLCCGGTRSRKGCEYHDPALQAASEAPAPTALTLGGIPLRITSAPARVAVAAAALPAGARLLGLDDPEVSTDMIYAVPGGGVIGAPQAAPATLAAEAAPLSKCACQGLLSNCFDCAGVVP